MRVVFVDPSRTTTKFVRRVLDGRHDVRTFADGAEALAYIESDPDVGAVITSAEPLSISGYEVCWEARLLANSHRPIYVLMMSAGIGDKALMEALDSGADDFVGKPPVAEELYARLRAAERVAGMQRELIRLATTDTLTGLFNRRAFFDRATILCAQRASDGALSAVMMDIDHFKKINDTFGHDGGDEALRVVARQVMAEKAVAGRLGGEEFALLLDGCSKDDAAALADRLRATIAACEIEIAGHAVRLTCSFGVSALQADDSIDALLRRTDMALYEAKSRGRNRVVTDDGLTVPNYSTVGRPVRSAERRRA